MSRLSEWWKGKWVPATIEESDRFTSIEGGYRVRPLLARVLIPAGRYCARHWMELTAILLALFSLHSCFS